jgi:RHS repeat-associated protein
MHFRLLISLFVLMFAFSANALRYEILKNGNDLLIKEKDEFIFVGTDVLAPILLPYQEAFQLLTANGNGYTLSSVSNTENLSSWTLTDSLVFKGNFIGNAPDEFFIQGKGIALSGGAKSAYVTSNSYIGAQSNYFSAAVASASSGQLTMVTSGSKNYIQLDVASAPTIRFRSGELPTVFAEDIGSVKVATDDTLIQKPISSVTSAGSLTSSYPINLPAATGGLKPNLAISYMSNGPKNGLLGYGFALSGLEVITHCPFNTDTALGEYKKGNLSSNISGTLYCYNGSPLVAYSTSDGSMVQQAAPVSQVAFIAKNNPQYRFTFDSDSFTLRLPSGAEKVFSRINGMAWAVTKVTDIYDNEITYNYEDAADKTSNIKLTSITWGDFSAGFTYSKKRNDFDINLNNAATTFYSQQDLLTDITVKKDAVSLNSYHIKYDLLNNVARYAVNSIQSCGYKPSKLCAKPVVYNWRSGEQNDLTVASQSITNSTLNSSKSLTPVKLSADGGDELIYKDKDNKKLYIAGSSSAIYTAASNTEIVSVHPYLKSEGVHKLYVLTRHTNTTTESTPIKIGEKYGLTGESCGSSTFSCSVVGNSCRSIPESCISINGGPLNCSYPNPPRYGCYGTIDVMGTALVSAYQYTYKWEVLENTGTSNSLTRTSNIAAGCHKGDAELPTDFLQTTPMLSVDSNSNGIKDVYLRVFTRNGSINSGCISSGYESNYAVGYAKYTGGNMGAMSGVWRGNAAAGYEGTYTELNSAIRRTGFRTFNTTNDYLQSDIDGNGVLDDLVINTNSNVVTINFNTPYTGSLPTVDPTDRVPTKSISVTLASAIILPLDIDHDGIQEILYMDGSDLKYIKLFYSPIDKKVSSASYHLLTNIGSMSKLILADTDNDGFHELLAASAGSIKTVTLSKRPVISDINYGPYKDVITFDNDAAVSLSSTVVVGQRKRKPAYEVVYKFQQKFKDIDGVYSDLSRIRYSYLNPAVHTQHGYSLGFERVVKYDDINLSESTARYYQDILKRGLLKSVYNLSQVAGVPKTVNRVINTYKQHSVDNLGLGLDQSTKTSYIKGLASNYTRQTSGYDNYGRVTSVNSQLYSQSNQLIKSTLVGTQYKRNWLIHTGAFDTFPKSVSTVLTIPAVSPLIGLRNASGSKTMRKVYTESTTVPGTIVKVTSGYLNTDNAFVQTSASYVEQLLGNKGNASKTIQYGNVGDRTITTQFSDYVANQPQTITVLNGSDATSTSNISRSYDDLGRLLTETAINGVSTGYSYDAFGRVLTLNTSRDDASYHYASCANDSVCSSLPNSSDIAWVSQVDWMSGKKEYSFSDAKGRSIGQAWKDALGGMMYSWSTYDSRNRISKEYAPCELSSCTLVSPHTAYTYEANIADPWQVTKTLADDTSIKTTFKTGSCATTLGTSSICVNASGTAVTPYYTQETLVNGTQPKLGSEGAVTPSTPSAATHKTYQVYDMAGNVFASVEGYGSAARAVVFSRGTLGNNTLVHQRFGNESTQELLRSYAYTEAGVLKSDINAVGVKETYRFNGHGDLLDSYMLGADGKLYGHDHYNYDVIGRLQGRENSHSTLGINTSAQADGSYTVTGLIAGRNYSYSYSANQGISVPAGFACDGAFELCSESVSDSVSGINSYKNYSYTSDGLLDGKFETINNTHDSVIKNAEFTYGYYPSGQLQTENLNGYVIQHQYAFGQLTRMTDHHAETLWSLSTLATNGSVSGASILGTNELIYDTDVLGRNTISTTLDANGASVNSWAQGFNHMGTAAFRQSVSAISKAENFEYDGFAQIDQTEMAGVNPYDYTVDKWANLTARRGVATQFSSVAANCASQISGSGVNALPARTGSDKWLASSRGSQQYCYDQLGRQAISGANAIEYYVNGQAARIKNAQSDIRLSYDSQGTPNVEIQTSTDSTKNYTAWLFDSGRYEVRDDNGTISTRIYPSNDIRVTYVGASTTPTYDYVMTDTMGSVTGLARKNGSALIVDNAKTRGYTPFGEHRDTDNWNALSTADTGDAYGFTGQRFLGEFGLYQFVGRIYDADQGRFTGPDPIVSQPGNWNNYNPYTYVYNDPMGWTDPTGLSGIPAWQMQMDNFYYANTISQDYWSASQNYQMALDYGIAQPVNYSVAAVQPSLGIQLTQGIDYGLALASYDLNTTNGNDVAIVGVVAAVIAMYAVETIFAVAMPQNEDCSGCVNSLTGFPGAAAATGTVALSKGVFKSTRVIDDVVEKSAESVIHLPETDKFGRVISRNASSLQDEMTLGAAKKGEGFVKMSNLSDAKYKGWDKMELNTTSANGAKTRVHYNKNQATRETADFKFIFHSTDSKPFWY